MFKEITPKELQDNSFKLIGDDWLLITAEHEGKANAMTASWGGTGIMWGQEVVYIGIRPQRFTKGLVDQSSTLSICVLPEGNKERYGYLGSASGRNEDKVAGADLTLCHDGETPYFEESRLVLICEKLFAQEMKPEAFLDPAIIDRWYPGNDFHTMYICAIKKVMVKDA